MYSPGQNTGILEWVAFPFSRGSSQLKDRTQAPALQADSLPAKPLGQPMYVCMCVCVYIYIYIYIYIFESLCPRGYSHLPYHNPLSSSRVPWTEGWAESTEDPCSNPSWVVLPRSGAWPASVDAFMMQLPVVLEGEVAGFPGDSENCRDNILFNAFPRAPTDQEPPSQSGWKKDRPLKRPSRPCMHAMGIIQAGILEWDAMPFSRGSRD